MSALNNSKGVNATRRITRREAMSHSALYLAVLPQLDQLWDLTRKVDAAVRGKAGKAADRQ